MNSRLNYCDQHYEFHLCHSVYEQWNFNCSFLLSCHVETFHFSEWQVIPVVEATFFHSSAISFTNFSHKKFILREHASLQLWQAFVTPCIDLKSVSPIRRSVQISYWKDVDMRSSSRACVILFPTSCKSLFQT